MPAKKAAKTKEVAPEVIAEQIVTAWEPTLSPKQKDLLKLCRAKTGHMKFIGVFGTRLSGKTQGAMAAIADHLWNTKDGSVLVLCYTSGTAATSGIWSELIDKILPEWIAGGFGMQWYMEPKIHGATKKMIGSVVNKYGAEALEKGEEIPPHGISKIELDTLDDEREVEKRYKGRYYSMIYWSEAGEFKESLSLKTLMMALRISGLADDEHVLLIDANPPDSGEEHFLFKYFYELRTSSEAHEEDKDIQQCLHVTEWSMDDNPFISESRKNMVKSTYRDDPDQYNRYIRGMWVKSTKGALFSDIFRKAIHCCPEDEELLVEENCTELITGHDEGYMNPVSYFIEKIIENVEVQTKTGIVHKPVSKFKILRELAYIGVETSVASFTSEKLQMMNELEAQASASGVIWRHWSDTSALNRKQSISQSSVADEMFMESDGRIKLKGVDKGRGSVGQRIRLLRKLIIEGRILISGVHCPKLIEMFQGIKKGKLDGTIATHSPHKHPFDALTYALSSECWDELQDMVVNIRLAKVKKVDSGFLTAVRL